MPNGEMMIEQCDDDNGVNEDLCLNTCMQTSCGDGFIQSPNAD